MAICPAADNSIQATKRTHAYTYYIQYMLIDKRMYSIVIASHQATLRGWRARAVTLHKYHSITASNRVAISTKKFLISQQARLLLL